MYTVQLLFSEISLTNLVRIPDPNANDPQLLSEFNELEIDPIVWKSFITTALNKLYGLIGESSPFDILARPNNKQAIIKIYRDQEEVFRNSLMGYTFNLGRISSVDVNCYIRVVKLGNYIGLVID